MGLAAERPSGCLRHCTPPVRVYVCVIAPHAACTDVEAELTPSAVAGENTISPAHEKPLIPPT